VKNRNYKFKVKVNSDFCKVMSNFDSDNDFCNSICDESNYYETPTNSYFAPVYGDHQGEELGVIGKSCGGHQDQFQGTLDFSNFIENNSFQNFEILHVKLSKNLKKNCAIH
jgi:hypothetical protein